MNGVEKKIAYKGIKLILKMIDSKSPKLYVAIQWISGVVAALWALAICLDQEGFFSFMSMAEHEKFVVICTAIGALLTGAGFVAKLPSTDPKLISQEVKDAVINEAVQKGTHVPVSNAKSVI